MRAIILVIILFFSLQSISKPIKDFATEKDFLKTVVPEGATNQRVDDTESDINDDNLRDIYGVVRYTYLSKDQNREFFKNRIFVLHKTVDGKYIANAVSKEFEYGGTNGRAYVEVVEPIGRNSFYIQLNERSVCGVYVYKFTFKLIKNEWRVVGLDHSDSVCNNDSEIGLTPSYEKSMNFLTGKFIVKTYKLGKLAGTKTLMKSFPVYLLEKFDPINTDYGKLHK